MDYIQNLSREEKIILCKMITGGNFKELFKKNDERCVRRDVEGLPGCDEH